jgi:hypothetical protein
MIQGLYNNINQLEMLWLPLKAKMVVTISFPPPNYDGQKSIKDCWSWFIDYPKVEQ